MQNVVLCVKNLAKTFTTQQNPAVKNLSFRLNHGEILGILGPNGAGKTTTIQMLLGTLAPSTGSITYFGKDFVTNRSEILEKIGFASTYVSMPEHLSIKENLIIYGLLQGLHGKKLHTQITYFLDIFRLNEKRNWQFGSLSAGQKTRVLLAKAFLHEPEIVLLDEPTAALDPDIAEQIRNFISEEQRRRKLSLLFTSHNMQEITNLCDRVIVLKDGQLFANDSPTNLAAAVSTAHVHLTITEPLEKITTYATGKKLSYTVAANIITFNIDEHNIAQLLNDLALNQITYSHINIDKPSLEDYFLQVSNGIAAGRKVS